MGMGIENWINLCSDELNYKPIKEQLTELREDIENHLTVMIAGEFNAGKSTFINAMLGDIVLSSDITPETAMVTKLTFGSKRKMIAHYLNGMAKEFDDEWLQQLTAERDGEFQEIRRQLSYVELQVPYSILKRITIIDTPGLNANNEFHTKATERFIGRSDYVFFLFHAAHIGTATEIRWLKKFKDKDILPFGIINRIDELDEEEDELEALIDFNQPRIGHALQKLFGVSAKEALTGKLQKNAEMMEWSNWGEVDQLIERIASEENKQLERVFIRLMDPLRQMEGQLQEKKVSLPLHKLPNQQVENFVTEMFPEMLALKATLEEQKKKTALEYEGWSRLFQIKIQKMDDLIQYVKEVIENLNKLSNRTDAMVENDLLEIHKLIESQYAMFSEKLNDFNDTAMYLKTERENLDQSWKAIISSNRFTKKRKLQKHVRKLDYYHQKRDLAVQNQQELNRLFNGLVDEIKVLDQSIQKIIKDHFKDNLDKELEEIQKWNTYIKEIKLIFLNFTKEDFLEVKSFSHSLYEFQHNVAAPLFQAGQSLDSFFDLKEVNSLLGNITNQVQSLPPQGFYLQWPIFDDFSIEHKVKYEFDFPNLLPPELECNELESIPRELYHDVEGEIEDIRIIKNRLFKYGGIVLLLTLIPIVYSYIAPKIPSSGKKESSYAVDAKEAQGVSQTKNVQKDEKGKKTLEHQYSREYVKSYLENLHQQLEEDPTDAHYFFDNLGWASYLDYFDDLNNGGLEAFKITEISYPSEDKINATVKETITQSGAVKEYETTYTLIKDGALTEEDLLISAFSSKLINESEKEISLEDGEIEEFLSKFRSAYMQALNEGDGDYINDFIEMDSSIYIELQNYISSITDKGYSFDEQGFQVEQITKVGTNQYRVTAVEQFLFTDDLEKETNYERTKDYIVKVLPEQELVIQNIVIKKTRKEAVKKPTVQLVSREDIENFIYDYYSSLVDAFNGEGFSNIENYYEPNQSGYENDQAYITQMNELNMHMENLEFNIESVNEEDDNHYLVKCNLVDEYTDSDGAGDRREIQAVYKIRITENEEMVITETPLIKILNKTALESE